MLRYLRPSLLAAFLALGAAAPVVPTTAVAGERPAPPEVGSTAPAFTLKDADGREVSLTSLLEKGPVVLYFYPRDFTPGCTAEACAYRDRSDSLRALGATVVGVSMDSVETHAKFRDRYRLDFPLLADEDGAVSRLYGVAGKGSRMAARWTFVIGRDGKIASVLKNVDPVAHIEKVEAVLRSLQR